MEDAYFRWLCDAVCRDRFSKDISYKKLLKYLHKTEFRWSKRKDAGRATDGVALRYKSGISSGLNLHSEPPCTVLEMMVALAMRMEQDIMDDPHIGNRTGQWFWGMINNLGLGAMTDNHFDEQVISAAVKRFLDRKYEYDGTGGLFKVRGCRHDMRKTEIWIQMLWYLDTIT